MSYDKFNSPAHAQPAADLSWKGEHIDDVSFEQPVEADDGFQEQGMGHRGRPEAWTRQPSPPNALHRRDLRDLEMLRQQCGERRAPTVVSPPSAPDVNAQSHAQLMQANAQLMQANQFLQAQINQLTQQLAQQLGQGMGMTQAMLMQRLAGTAPLSFAFQSPQSFQAPMTAAQSPWNAYAPYGQGGFMPACPPVFMPPFLSSGCLDYGYATPCPYSPLNMLGSNLLSGAIGFGLGALLF